jgi:hypothetical protein
MALAYAGVAGAQKPDAASSDAQIATQVKDQIDADAGIAYEQVTVDSRNGVVTLSGTVGSAAARSAAANDAAKVEGVRVVVNNLEVTSAQAASEATAAAAPPPQAVARADRANDIDNPLVRADPAEAPQPIMVPAGTRLTVHIYDEVSSQNARVGDVFRGALVSPVTVNGVIAIPETAEVEGSVLDVKPAKNFGRAGLLNLQLTKIEINGSDYALETASWSRAGNAQVAQTALEIASGTAGGAAVGGSTGSGKGAGIGAGVGAGLGILAAALTKGEPVVIMPEAVIGFTIRTPLAINPGEEGRPQRRH